MDETQGTTGKAGANLPDHLNTDELRDWNREFEERFQSAAGRSDGFSFIARILRDHLPEARLKVACSLQREDIVILDHLVREEVDFRVYCLDTGRLHPETYEMMDSIQSRFGKQVEVYFPRQEKVEEIVARDGQFGFMLSPENRKECCHIRKIESNQRALSTADGYFTGLRREQSPARAQTPVFSFDEENGHILKIAPLIFWTGTELADYVREKNLPDHPLYARGFTSIGCAPCTRAIEPGEDERAGRWWWELDGQKECGLHS